MSHPKKTSLTLTFTLLLTLTTTAQSTTYTFQKTSLGAPPSKTWLPTVTGSKKGTPPNWQIVNHNNQKVLAQLEPAGKNNDFPVCLLKNSSLKNGSITARLKPISGSIDQAGGLILRAQDQNNFYVARANALENNVSFYVTINSKRKTLKYWDNIPVPLNQFHNLKVTAQNATFKIYLNNKFVGQIKDPANTFPNAGMTGFWTKADSITHFQSLTVTPTR